MSQEIDIKVTYRIVFTEDGVPETLEKMYRIDPSELYATVMGLHYMGESKDLYVFSAGEGVHYFGEWSDGTEEEQVYGPIEWKVIPGVIRRTN